MRSIFLLCLLIVTFSVRSQTPEPYKYLGNYTQPAPNVASLGKYVDYPVGYYTGTPQISIPLYNLQDGTAKTSIYLSYHASGIRVAELASWVGLGWALNAGGMITRSVRGAPDEGAYSPQTATGGYYTDSGIRKMPLLPYPINGAFSANDGTESSREQFRGAIMNGQGDVEPDLFTFNVDGYGGKFVFDENRTPRLLADQDIKISVNYSNGFSSWTIITPDGVKYLFGEGGINEVNQIYSSSSGLDNNSLKPTSWLLTRIIYPNTKDTISFNYVSETYSYYDLAQETTNFDGSGGNYMQLACALTPRPFHAYKTTVSGYRLANIISRNYKITFGVNTASARQDLMNNGSNYPYSLDSIKIFNFQNQCFKQFVLGHQYFTSSTSNNMYSPVLGFISGDVTDTKRLKLVSVKELSGDGTITKPPYNIEYQEDYQLPRRLSYDIDHWGFSNNYNGNVNDRFTPTVYHPICNTVATGANRDPKWPDMQQCAIKSIKDPLGVLTTFEFEAHTSSMIANSTVGGLRIKKIATTDSVTGVSNVRTYTYGIGGTLYKTPQYLYTPDNEFYFPALGLVFGYYYKGYVFNEGFGCLIKQSQSIVPLQDFQGNHIGYSMVKETYGPNGEGGYKAYSFMADQLGHNTSRLNMSNYTALATIVPPAGSNVIAGTITGTYGNGRFNDIPADSLVYYDGYNVDNFYPAAPIQVDFRRGQLLRESTYDSINKLLHEVINTYAENYHENLWIRGFKFYRTIKHEGTSGPNFEYPNLYDDAMTFYKLHTGVSHLVSTTTTDYKDGKSMTSVTSYKYESPYHTQKTFDSTVNSTGDALINKTYYSFDYTNNATADTVFGKLKARNMLVPVATRSWKNNKLLNGTITLYKDFASNPPDTFLNPVKIYAVETTNPLTTSEAGESISYTSQFTMVLPSSYFKEKAVFTVDGSSGRIIEQKLTNDRPQSLIWDNKLSLPLAQIENATSVDVAYSSFESTETGNWSYSAGSISSDNTAPTGSKAYSINGAISKGGLASSQTYILSYWLKTGGSLTITGGNQSNTISGRTLNGWTYKQVTLTGTTSISLSGSGSVDEVRLHPADAQMTTYTYDGLLRLIAQCSPNNTINYYEYDSMNRLTSLKDQFGNVLKTYEYNYGRGSRPGN